ncbi:MAG: efflux RND transporter periplasmic adaptor subunit, partial [Armatimonadota bacterium]
MNTKLMILVVIAMFVSAGSTYTFMKRSTPVSPTESAPTEAAAPLKIAGLKVEPALAGAGWDSIAVTGKVTVPPDRLVKVSPRIEGKVVMARGTVGDAVRRGQTLAVISSVTLAEARAEYRQAQAKLTAAQQNYERELHIAKLGATSVRPVEEARSESLSSQGELADAKSALSQAKSDLVREEGELAQCKARLERARELYADKIVSKHDLETAEAEYKRDSAAVASAASKVSQSESRIGKAASKLEISGQYLNREEKIYKGRVLDMRALQIAKSEIAAAKVEAQAASDRIRVLGASPSGSGDTVSITSPIDGRIISRQTNVGEMASPADALFTVANLSQVWVEADIYEKDLARIRNGQVAEILVDAYPGKVFTGRVDSISDMLSSESRTAKVRCVVPNS